MPTTVPPALLSRRGCLRRCAVCNAQAGHPLYDGKCEDCWVLATSPNYERTMMKWALNADVPAHGRRDRRADDRHDP
jgi:hypothetical protein